MRTASPPAAERLEAALELAQRLGYRIRMESLAGQCGGGCEIGGQKWLFLDLSLTPREQLDQVFSTLRREAAGLAKASQKLPGASPQLAATATPQPEPNRELSPVPPKSSPGFLPRWRSWYRMIVSRRSPGR
jgi:hypothetical protein